MERLEEVWKKMSLTTEEEEEEVDGVRSRPRISSGDEDKRQELPFIKLTSKSLNYEKHLDEAMNWRTAQRNEI